MGKEVLTKANQKAPAHKELSVKQIAQKTSEHERREEVLAATKNAVNLINLTKGETRVYTTYNKELFRNYIKNPLTNENRLRNLSRFLYRLSYPYRRIVHYYAGMTDLTAWIAEPAVDLVKENNTSKVRKDYAKAVMQLRKMNMPSQIMKLLIIAWREDAAFGYTYEDNDAFFIMPLDGDYCKISSQEWDGTFNFAFDFSYFSSREYLLDYWAPEFRTKYDAYKKDPTLKWQELDPDRTFCIKVNQDDPVLCLPPFVSLFESIIDLIDLQSIQAVKESLSAYKMVIMVEKTLEKATEPDQFTVDIDSAVAFYNKIAQELPPEVSSGISLLPIEVIDFKGNTTEDTDMVSNSMSNLFKNAGVSQILDRQKIEGSVAFTAAMISDSLLSTSNLLPQIETWVNRYIFYSVGKIGSHITYLKVTPYTKGDTLTKALSCAEYGVPAKEMVASLLGLDPYQSFAMNYLESEVLKLQDTWIPLQSSHTQSGKATAPSRDNITTDKGRPEASTDVGSEETTVSKSESTTTITKKE